MLLKMLNRSGHESTESAESAKSEGIGRFFDGLRISWTVNWIITNAYIVRARYEDGQQKAERGDLAEEERFISTVQKNKRDIFAMSDY